MTVKDRIVIANKIAGLLLVIFSISIVIPLIIETLQNEGGPLGFEIMGLSLLLPLGGYILFGFAGLVGSEENAWKIFLMTHAFTIVLGFVGYFLFPLYPWWILVIPLVLAIISVISRRNFNYSLLLMIVLGLGANLSLLVWEINLGNAVPLIELFQ